MSPSKTGLTVLESCRIVKGTLEHYGGLSVARTNSTFSFNPEHYRCTAEPYKRGASTAVLLITISSQLLPTTLSLAPSSSSPNRTNSPDTTNVPDSTSTAPPLSLTVSLKTLLQIGLNLHESKDTNTVTATFELPGWTSESVSIDVHENRLTVSGESAVSVSQEEGNYVVRERRSGKFSRTLQLPFGTKVSSWTDFLSTLDANAACQPEDVKARMENGILTITFPKASPERQAKRIAIQ
ncbi:HSP20-like chaperone [Butyriboletus roseoflavus]|nr:HSP20-like chaperone [Butyriboletus roseoflavus]